MSDRNELVVTGAMPPVVFTIKPEALQLRDDALAGSALIGKVETSAQNENAVRAHIELKRIASSFEKARKALKEPILQAGRDLDRAVNAELIEVEKEIGRLANLTTQFNEAEQRRVREEQELQRKELERIEREKVEALAKATTPDQVAIIEERAQVLAASESKPIVATRAAGQVVKQDWQIQITNPWELAKFHPNAVKIEPLLGEIKSMLNQGIKVLGVRAEKITKSSVRVQTAATIDV